MRRLNVIGPEVVRLRLARNWTQETLAAKLQCGGTDISRQMLANIESRRTNVTDAHIIAFHQVFNVPIVRLFPNDIQERDARVSEGDNNNARFTRPKR
jgi:transcriptional regulator with XRE-family HTH domain